MTTGNIRIWQEEKRHSFSGYFYFTYLKKRKTLTLRIYASTEQQSSLILTDESSTGRKISDTLDTALARRRRRRQGHRGRGVPSETVPRKPIYSDSYLHRSIRSSACVTSPEGDIFDPCRILAGSGSLKKKTIAKTHTHTPVALRWQVWSTITPSNSSRGMSKSGSTKECVKIARKRNKRQTRTYSFPVNR